MFPGVRGKKVGKIRGASGLCRADTPWIGTQGSYYPLNHQQNHCRDTTQHLSNKAHLSWSTEQVKKKRSVASQMLTGCSDLAVHCGEISPCPNYACEGTTSIPNALRFSCSNGGELCRGDFIPQNNRHLTHPSVHPRTHAPIHTPKHISGQTAILRQCVGRPVHNTAIRIVL